MLFIIPLSIIGALASEYYVEDTMRKKLFNYKTKIRISIDKKGYIKLKIKNEK